MSKRNDDNWARRWARKLFGQPQEPEPVPAEAVGDLEDEREADIAAMEHGARASGLLEDLIDDAAEAEATIPYEELEAATISAEEAEQRRLRGEEMKERLSQRRPVKKPDPYRRPSDARDLVRDLVARRRIANVSRPRYRKLCTNHKKIRRALRAEAARRVRP